MKTRHLIDLDTVSLDELEQIFTLADIIMRKPQYFQNSAQGKMVATLFYEPSTRTQLSFQSATLRLGGTNIGFDNPLNSSVSKGESLKDTVRVVSNYADLIVIRHASEGAAKAASLFSRCPVINAGDGGHLHPTQTLTDLFTLRNTKVSLNHMTVGLCGDLKFGRTVHSLIRSLVRYQGNQFVFISTPELSVPDYIKREVTAAGCKFRELDSLEAAMPLIDVLYMTRIQRERFQDEASYQKQRGVFVLDAKKLRRAKYGLKILHPLPRVDEIDYEVDDDERAAYFAQTEYGMYVRMALILTMLEDAHKRLDPAKLSNADKPCSNPRCITKSEPYLPKLFQKSEDGYVCEFCEHTRK